MKNLIITLCALFALTTGSVAQHKTTKQKNMIAYFSATGTTKAVAQKIVQATGGTLVAITPTSAYTAADLDWHDQKSRSTIEMKNPKARPTIKKAPATDGYSVVYIGFPIWWDEAPRVINTFIESHNLKGAKIVPFATSGGSTINNSVKVLRQTYPTLNWQTGKLLNNPSQKTIDSWVKQF